MKASKTHCIFFSCIYYDTKRQMRRKNWQPWMKYAADHQMKSNLPLLTYGCSESRAESSNSLDLLNDIIIEQDPHTTEWPSVGKKYYHWKCLWWYGIWKDTMYITFLMDWNWFLFPTLVVQIERIKKVYISSFDIFFANVFVEFLVLQKNWVEETQLLVIPFSYKELVADSKTSCWRIFLNPLCRNNREYLDF